METIIAPAFVLISTVTGFDGTQYEYVEDHALTAEDCTDALVDPEYIARAGYLSCEVDHNAGIVFHEGEPRGLPYCPTEDSANCLWDATRQGNGIGDSFYVIGDTVYYL